MPRNYNEWDDANYYDPDEGYYDDDEFGVVRDECDYDDICDYDDFIYDDEEYNEDD